MNKEKKYFPKPPKTFLSIIAYGAGAFFIFLLIASYWLLSPYTQYEPTSRFISKGTDIFISFKFDPNDSGFSEVSLSILSKFLEANKDSLLLMNIPQSFISFIEKGEERENLKLFLPYEVGYFVSFKKNQTTPLQVIVINLRYFKNFFKIFLKSLLQIKPKIINVIEGNLYRKSLFLYPVFRESSSEESNTYLTFYTNNIIYLNNDKILRDSIDSYQEDKTPFYERSEVKDFYDKLILSENISFIADNREDSLSNYINWKIKGDVPKRFFDIIDIISGNADVKKDDVITGLAYLNLKKIYSEENLHKELNKLKQKLQSFFHLNIDFQLEKDRINNCYILKFKCVGLMKLLMNGIERSFS